MSWSNEEIDIRGLAVNVCNSAFPVDHIKPDQCVYVLDTYIFYYIKAYPSDCSHDNWIIELRAAIAGDNWIIELMADISDAIIDA